MKTQMVHTSKLGDQSKQVVNLGREPSIKGYRLYDPVSEKIYISRDVVFDETASWPWAEKKKKAIRRTQTCSQFRVNLRQK